MTEIRRCSGTQFDPALTEAFLRIDMDKFKEILADHSTRARQLMDSQPSLRCAVKRRCAHERQVRRI